MTKTCRACDVQLPIEFFYENDNTCKECRKAKVRANRAANIEKYRAYDQARAMCEDRVKKRGEYMQTESGKIAHRRASNAYYRSHKDRRAATIALNNAVRDGRVIKQPCFVCGAEDVEGHHPHYGMPLDVVWLCVAHHKELHRQHLEYA